MKTIVKRKLKTTTKAAIIFFAALMFFGSIWFLHQYGIIKLPEKITKISETLIFLTSVILVANLINRFSLGKVFKLFDQPEEQIFYTKIWSYAVYSIAIVIILFYFGVALGDITLFLGLMATGFAFAIRDILLSFFGWLILLRKKPFRIGDYIRIGNDEGKVIHIGTFHVLLDKTFDIPEDYTRVPNRLFLEQSINKLGTENISEQLCFPIEAPIDEQPDILKEIEDHLNTTLLINNNYTSVYYDIKENKLFLVVDYIVPIPKRKEIRSKVVCAVNQKTKGKVIFRD